MMYALIGGQKVSFDARISKEYENFAKTLPTQEDNQIVNMQEQIDDLTLALAQERGLV